MKSSEFFNKFKSFYLWGNLLGMAVAIVLVCLGVRYGLDICAHHGESIAIPDVKRKPSKEAEKVLSRLDSRAVVSDTGYVKTIPPDCVLKQASAASDKVKTGRIIYLTVNASKSPTITLSDVVDNSSLRETIAKLTAMGFRVDIPQFIPGEKDWVYGILVRGKHVVTGDRISIEDTVIIQAGNGMRDSTDVIDYIGPIYPEYDPSEEDDVDGFEEVTGPVMETEEATTHPQEVKPINPDKAEPTVPQKREPTAPRKTEPAAPKSPRSVPKQEQMAEEAQDMTLLEDDEEQQLYEHFRIVVGKGQEPLRVDRYMFERLKHSSRNRIQKAADARFVHVNDQPVKSNYKARPLDVIILMLDAPRHGRTIEAEDIPLDIVCEDSDLMVINKAPGMVVHPGAGNFHRTLINAVAWHLKDLTSFNANDPAVGLVHRIDKDISGLLVIAKTPVVKAKLGLQFFNKTTHRSYNVLVWGNFDEEEGRIEGNTGRDPRDRLRMNVSPPDSEIGKSAVTHYRIFERFGYVTPVECIPETGRTYQIRAHMKHIGHPLFGDERYGGTEVLHGQHSSTYKAFIQDCFKMCNRQALHTKTLGFVYPTTGRQMDFTSDLPNDIQQLLNKWSTYIHGTNNDTFEEQTKIYIIYE